jgi:hypothetical protein
MVTCPEEGAVQLYQTVFSPSDPLVAGRWSGSPDSLVAPTFVALTVAPLMDCALAKLSLAGLWIGTPAASAMLILGFVTPPATRVSVTGVPVLCRDERRLLTEAVGVFCLRRAHAPATCGVAMEVPSNTANPPPGTEEFMLEPGARRCKKEAELENDDRVSDFVVEPTLTALDIQPGLLMESLKPLFPEAITVAIPADLRLSIIAFGGCVSQLLKKRPPPMLMFTEEKLRVDLRAYTRSNPATISLV